jgi:hypothetical protein
VHFERVLGLTVAPVKKGTETRTAGDCFPASV